jgi:hypothetical protein
MRFLAFVMLAACGSGEPMNGTITVQYGSDSVGMEVGAVVADEDDPNKMLVQMGSREVDCDTQRDALFGGPRGTFVFFSIDQAAGAYTQTPVEAAHREGNSISVNFSTGDVTIDAVGERVTGSMTFETTDDEVGTISVSGTFDVFKCF